MPDFNESLFTIPAVPAQPPINPATTVLRGFTTRFELGAPKRLVGADKLRDDLRFIIQRTLLINGLLKLVLNDAALGNVSKLLKTAIENTDNWWPGQALPVKLSDLKITLRKATRVGGVTLDADDAGNLEIRVGYIENATGVTINVDGQDALVVPFDATLAGGFNV